MTEFVYFELARMVTSAGRVIAKDLYAPRRTVTLPLLNISSS